ncbi:MAG: anthranilate synthase component I [Pseudomonadota bacterium]
MIKRLTWPAQNIFLEKAATYNLIPVYQEIWGDTETAIGVFKKVATGPVSFLLESVQGGDKWGRYSFLGITPLFLFKSKGEEVFIEKQGGGQTKEYSSNPFKIIKTILDTYKVYETEGLPRFFGGAVGYIAYDIVRFFEKLPDKLPDTLNLPDSQFVIPELVLIFDNLEQSIKVVCNVHIQADQNPGIGAEQILNKEYDLAVSKIETLIEKILGPLPVDKAISGNTSPMKPMLQKEEFEVMVDKAKEYIKSGDIIQAVLSQRLEAETSADPFDIYRALRRINPSPYLFYLKFDDMVLLGSSPEVMVRAEGDRVTLRPIAGTRHRGKTDEEDKALEIELLADPKERAEHVMLVDLGRNDLGRVCVYGSVKATEVMVIERYSHVMHIVSNVEGILKKGVDSFDVLAATFPAGTVSGAPKIRAMEIIEELEPGKRGTYAGAVGYFSFSGNMDLAITIRSILIHNHKAIVQVGAGIVADSVPEKEYEETLNKGKALFRAVEMAGRGLL